MDYSRLVVKVVIANIFALQYLEAIPYLVYTKSGVINLTLEFFHVIFKWFILTIPEDFPYS